MKILAFAGSNSKKSINKQLATYASSLFSSAEVELLDLNDFHLPMYGVDEETANGLPETVLNFGQKISNADLIVISLAEHNGSYAAVFKNLYDWISRIPNRKVFDGTPLLLMATSPGGRGGASVLAAANDRFPRDGGEILAEFSFPSFQDNFQDGKITNPELDEKLKSFVEQIQNKVTT